MNTLTKKAVAARVALQAHLDRVVARARDDESGQGTVEYVGVILVVAAIVTVVLAADEEVGKAIVDQLTKAVEEIGQGE